MTTKGRVAWASLRFAVLVSALASLASVSPAEEITNLPPLNVREQSFGRWGIGMVCHYTFFSSLVGGPSDWIDVVGVITDSAADRAGIEIGDTIKKINGREITRIRKKEIGPLFYDTASGDVINLELFSPFKKRTYEVSLKVSSAKNLSHSDQMSVWGVTVVADWSKSPGKIYLDHRMMDLTWSQRKLVLKQLADDTVEMSEGTEKRILKRGTVLELNPDGRYSLSEPKPKAVLP